MTNLYVKSYTRETTFPIQQAWMEANTSGLRTCLGLVNPFQPYTFYFMHDGTIEIWEHKEYVQWIREILARESFVKKLEMQKILEQYEKGVADLYALFQNGPATSAESLSGVMKQIHELMMGYVLMYYGAMNDAMEPSVHALAKRLREADAFFDTCDGYIRRSLQKLFPELGEYEAVILESEIVHPPTVEECRRRFAGCVILPTTEIIFGSLEQFIDQHSDMICIDEVLEPINVQELRGKTAYQGMVKGRIKVLWRKSQMSDVMEGDIIVAPMTTPAILPAMKIAGAFITDEGGITCHAAIVARELRKPCIIGTKIATKVLKDGDEVEVDATKGIVRILKRQGGSL